MTADPRARSYLELTARQRLAGILDPGSFTEFLPPPDRVVSPHLPALDLPVAFDDGIVVGTGRLDGRPVLIAAQEGGFMGGAVGEVHGAKLTGLLERALDEQAREDGARGVVLLLETGGVRLQEANAGLVAMGEVQQALLDLRLAGVPVVVAIGGANGCYGGLSIICRSADALVMSEAGRLSISGPEVIETACGAEEFDARDRALVWRTMGGKHRRLLGDCDALVADDPAAFRAAILHHLAQPRPLDLATLEAEHAMLRDRIAAFGDCADATEVWGRLGVDDPGRVPDLDEKAFDDLVTRLGV